MHAQRRNFAQSMARRTPWLVLLSVSIVGAATLARLWGPGPQVAEAGTGADEKPQDEQVRLRNPGLDNWRAEYPGERGRWRSRPASGYERLALPTGFWRPIFDTYKKPRKVIGRARRGAALSVRDAGSPHTCFDNGKKGTWYEVEGGGYLCSTSGFKFVREASQLEPPQKNPRAARPMPFKYAKVTLTGSPRLSRRPTLSQWEGLAAIGGPKDDPSGLMVERMIGDFFVSLNGKESIEGHPFVRTVHNEYIEEKALKPWKAPNMLGERLDAGRQLPIAFVYGADETEVLCVDGDAVCGVAEKHARFRPSGKARVGNKAYYRTEDGILVPAESVRLAEAIGRPQGVGPDDKWVHIDLARQTLVAYEGETPVYATLVSSGKEGHTTPSGLYRIQRKYLTKTMRAVDPKEGLYHIEDIPWTMYYYGAYAVHGAFWHDVFGEVRSHGCTNVAPADARWIYHWSDHPVPEGWHARENIQRGTAFYFTNTSKQPS